MGLETKSQKWGTYSNNQGPVYLREVQLPFQYDCIYALDTAKDVMVVAPGIGDSGVQRRSLVYIISLSEGTNVRGMYFITRGKSNERFRRRCSNFACGLPPKFIPASSEIVLPYKRDGRVSGLYISPDGEHLIASLKSGDIYYLDLKSKTRSMFHSISVY